MKIRILCVLCLLLLSINAAWGIEKDAIPQHISVLPVFFVPKGQPDPTEKHFEMVVQHLEIAQQRYKTMLKNRDTFSIADMEPQVVHDSYTLQRLKGLKDKKLGQYIVSRLLRHFEVNRFNCPYIFLVVIMNSEDAWPTPGGRPINLGFNSGGGFALFPSNRMDQENPPFQGTIQHELGHTFGLVHVEAYGYDQQTNKSVMAYNKTNQWSGFNPPQNPGILIPEDIRGLSMNKRVFANLYFDREKDIPEGYAFKQTLARLAFDETIPTQKPYEIKVASTCGQVNETNPGNIVLGWIRTNQKAKNGIGLIKNHMWMSDKAPDGWVDLDLEFPIAVRMNKIRVHSQCGGGMYPATAVRVEAEIEGFRELAAVEEVDTDAVDICFDEVRAKRWRLYFRPDQSGQVVIRGLQFFYSGGEIFCPKYPTYLIDCDTWAKN